MEEKRNDMEIQGQTTGEQAAKAVEEKSKDPTEARVKNINDAADRLEEAERRMKETENSLREAQATARIGGTTNAGSPKLTSEQEEQQEAEKVADEISSAFR